MRTKRAWILAWSALGAGMLYLLAPWADVQSPQHDQRRIVSAALAIRAAEEEFLLSRGRFGNLPEILPLVRGVEVAQGVSGVSVNGFRAVVEGGEREYRLLLAPSGESRSTMPRWTLYMDESGQLRPKYGLPAASVATPPMSHADLSETLKAIARSRR